MPKQTKTEKQNLFQQANNNQAVCCNQPAPEPVQLMTNLYLINENTNDQYLIEQFKITVDPQNQLKISQIVKDLAENGLEEILKAYVYLYLEDENISVYIGKDLANEEKTYQFQDKFAQQIRIKYRLPNIQQQIVSNDYLKEQEELNYINEQLVLQKVLQNVVPEKRQKERTIEFAILKVNEWRNLQKTGYQNGEKTTIKLNLDQAAKLIGLSRKTLDEYRSQIMKGEERNFDFNANLNQKIGVLRKFNRQFESSQDNQPETPIIQQQCNYDLQMNTTPENQSQIKFENESNQDFNTYDAFENDCFNFSTTQIQQTQQVENQQPSSQQNYNQLFQIENYQFDSIQLEEQNQFNFDFNQQEFQYQDFDEFQIEQEVSIQYEEIQYNQYMSQEHNIDNNNNMNNIDENNNQRKNEIISNDNLDQQNFSNINIFQRRFSITSQNNFNTPNENFDLEYDPIYYQQFDQLD